MTQGTLTMRRDISDIFALAENTAERLVAWERERHGVGTKEARQNVARQARISPGSLQRLADRRLKFVDRIAGPLNELLIRTIERKITDLEHELRLAKSRSSPVVDLARAEAALCEARRALGKE